MKNPSLGDRMVIVQVNVQNFQPRLDSMTGHLSLTVPCFSGPILHPDAVQGLTEQNAELLERAMHETYLRTAVGLILSQNVVTD